MNKILEELFFLKRSWPIRIWMWTALAAVLFYLVKFSLLSNPITSLIDMIILAYGIGSFAIYILIYGFDWS